MMQKKKNLFDSRIVVGILILLAGVLLLLDKMDIGVNVDIGDFWPVIIIVIGVGKILQPKENRQLYWGIVITAVGTLFLLNNLGYIHFWFNELWPILLILLGIEILRSGFFKHHVKTRRCFHHSHGRSHYEVFKDGEVSEEVDKDYIDVSVLLGSGNYRFNHKQLKGGQVSALMAGCELDLRNAGMEKDQLTLEISSIMSGVEIWVPTNWEVVMHGNPVLGGIEDKTYKPENPEKKLIIKGSVIMGGIEVKS